MDKHFIESTDGYKLELHLFDVADARAVIQIVHGMEEHQERYEPFVRFLNSQGYAVVSSDLRGHGSSAPQLGFFRKENGHLSLIDDQRAITKFIQSVFPQKPMVIFAHSFGTIITRVLLQTDSSNYSKIILSGFPNYQWAAHAGILLADVIMALHGPHYKSGLLQSLSTGAFNRRIKNPETAVDWVACNKDTVRKYLSDPLCGFGFTCSAYRDLYRLVIRMHNPGLYKNVNSAARIMMLRGEDDPCVGGNKGASDSLNVLLRAGFTDIHEISYPGMRHEILNEAEHQQVYSDILDFLSE